MGRLQIQPPSDSPINASGCADHGDFSVRFEETVGRTIRPDPHVNLTAAAGTTTAVGGALDVTVDTTVTVTASPVDAQPGSTLHLIVGVCV